MKKILTLVFAIAAAAAVHARTNGYVMFSVYSPGQLPVPSTSINGVRFSALYGECQSLNGLDIGVAGLVKEHMNGLQLNALASIVGTDAAGIQLGCFNYAEGDMDGLQVGLWNEAGGAAMGMQIGGVNRATAAYGLQCGVVNYAKTLKGVQLGLLNITGTSIDHNKTMFPVMWIGW